MVTALRSQAPTARSALLSALRVVEEERRQVGPAEAEELATLLDLSPMQVAGVARFYDLLSSTPRGQRVLAVCRGIACFLHGSQQAIDMARASLGVAPGETTPDRRFTLRLVECIGDCDHAPAGLLDDAFVGPLTEERLRAVLSEPGAMA